MAKKSHLFFMLASCLILLVQEAHASRLYHVGYEDIQSPYQGRIWYPISPSIKEEAIPSSPIFKTLYAKKDAPLTEPPKKLSLLIISHGSGGMVYRFDWIADYFVRSGWIVAGINHPGNTYGDNSARGFLRVWERPQQISNLIDFLLNKHPFSSKIDQTKIGAIGHSAGGTTALMLAGTKMSKELFQQPLPRCKSQPKEFDDEDCDNLKKINFASFKKDEVEGNYKDKRIKAVVALDPGFARSFPHGQKTNIPIYIFFADKLKDSSGEIYARDFLKVLSNIPYSVITDSVHISFVSECSEEGFKREVPICIGDGRKRNQIHTQANQQMLSFFQNIFVN